MIYFDRIYNRCKSIEDFSFLTKSKIMVKEIKNQKKNPIRLLLTYIRVIEFRRDGVQGIFFATGFGKEDSKSSGGWRTTYLNSFN
jgi:hypothetical protein